ncbi:hypothetical protein PVAND_011329 [Polypedilum vanderplanki]|uniref:Uncharacterized protein n=1 Tax=Polypedilum vanderplanki TaxID=319348 RepID=A0A9J6CK22_POLVA|nr:hypothetical protein PVAND_011329 [Polypedilum vanderplanki]
MDKFIDIKYKLVRQEKYEKILTELGVNTFMRKFLPIWTSSSTVELKRKSDDIYVLNTKRKFKTQSLEFKLNEEFEERMMNGEKVKSVIIFENNTMIHTQQSDPSLKITRNFFQDEMVTIMTYADVTCTNWYKAM